MQVDWFSKAKNSKDYRVKKTLVGIAHLTLSLSSPTIESLILWFKEGIEVMPVSN